jgi:bifunctional DNA-binding transcriptional regulator/antitoxin component of YhaV-PrlF toxin-antitoxin module
LTLPQEIVDQIGLKSGDVLEFATTGRGTIELRPARIVAVGTPEAEQEEAVAQEDIDRGRYSVIKNLDEFQRHVDRVRKGDYPSASQTLSSRIAPDEETAPEIDASVEIHIEAPVGDYIVKGAEEEMVSRLTPLQKLEVELIVQAALEKFVPGAAGSRPIMRRDAQNRVEQR